MKTGDPRFKVIKNVKTATAEQHTKHRPSHTQSAGAAQVTSPQSLGNRNGAPKLGLGRWDDFTEKYKMLGGWREKPCS